MKSFALLLWMLSSAFLMSSVIPVQAEVVHVSSENGVKTGVYLSPPFFLGPGSADLKYYYNIDFPRGHIAVKSFNAEVVDEAGNPVPLTEAYVHHWLIYRYYGRNTTVEPYVTSKIDVNDIIPVWSDGVCQGTILRQTTGFGSETRHTLMYVPDPYAIEVGNPAETPDGYEFRWMLNVHALDTRGVADRMGCTECRCNLFNVSKDASGKPFPKGAGGSFCCYDQTRCLLRPGSEKIPIRKLFMRYTVKWTDWDDSIVPVKVFIFDAADSGKRSPVDDTVGCTVEYEVEACSASDRENGRCVHHKKSNARIPIGGNVVYGVGHQHWGARGVALHGQDGRLLCESLPIYGTGNEVGNEDGYVVGMTNCFPKPGTVSVAAGEVLTVVSKYETTQRHTGIMGVFYILVAETPSANVLSSDPAYLRID